MLQVVLVDPSSLFGNPIRFLSAPVPLLDQAHHGRFAMWFDSAMGVLAGSD